MDIRFLCKSFVGIMRKLVLKVFLSNSRDSTGLVVIQNRPGASATVGTQFAARAAPDGSHILLGSTHHVINPTLQKSLPYDTKKDFTEIALVALVPNALVVNPDLPVYSVADLITSPRRVIFPDILRPHGSASMRRPVLLATRARSWSKQ